MKCMNPSCRMYGKELPAGAKFCGVCGQIVGSDSSYGGGSAGWGGRPAPAPGPAPAPAPAPKPASGGWGGGVNRMPEGIALGTDERIVKQYKIGRYTFRKGTIEVIVTNKRVIRYEESIWLGMQNNSIDEIFIDSVHGIKTWMSRSISILGLIFAVILFIVGMISLFGNLGFGRGTSGIQILIGLIALGLTALIVISSLKPSMVFAVLGSVGNDALRTKVNIRGRLFRNDDSSVIFQFKPTPETTVMLKEIGACIYDIKTLGDAAISKWS